MAASIITSTGTVSDAPGYAQGSHGFVDSAGTLWNFQYRSTSATTLYARYSTDGGVTWNDPTNPTKTLAWSTQGVGRQLGIAHAVVGTTDVVHIGYLGFDAGTNNSTSAHLRATISGTTITWGSETEIDNTAVLGTTAAPVAVASDGTVLQQVAAGSGGKLTPTTATNKDLSSSWTNAWSSANEVTILTPAAEVLANAFLPLAAGGKVLILSDNGSSATPNNLVYSLWGGSSWSPATAAAVFGSAVAINANDWGCCLRSDTDAHVVRRTGSNTYEHVRWNGTSWAAGQAIPAQTSKAGAGVTLVTDGTTVYLTVIDSDTANTIRQCVWTSGGGWGSWTAVETSTQVRTSLTAYYSSAKTGIGYSWSQVNGGTYDLAFEFASTSGGGGSSATAKGGASSSIKVVILVPTTGKSGSTPLVKAALTLRTTAAQAGAKGGAPRVGISPPALGDTGAHATALATLTLGLQRGAGAGSTATPHLTALAAAKAGSHGIPISQLTLKTTAGIGAHGTAGASLVVVGSGGSRGSGTPTLRARSMGGLGAQGMAQPRLILAGTGKVGSRTLIQSSLHLVTLGQAGAHGTPAPTLRTTNTSQAGAHGLVHAASLAIIGEAGAFGSGQGRLLVRVSAPVGARGLATPTLSSRASGAAGAKTQLTPRLGLSTIGQVGATARGSAVIRVVGVGQGGSSGTVLGRLRVVSIGTVGAHGLILTVAPGRMIAGTGQIIATIIGTGQVEAVLMTTTGTIVSVFATGDTVTFLRTLTGLPAPITSADLGIKRSQSDRRNVLIKSITTTITTAGQITNPGVLQPDGTYTATAQFTLSGDPSGDTSGLVAGETYWAYVRAYPGPYTSEIFQIVPESGGADG